MWSLYKYVTELSSEQCPFCIGVLVNFTDIPTLPHSKPLWLKCCRNTETEKHVPDEKNTCKHLLQATPNNHIQLNTHIQMLRHLKEMCPCVATSLRSLSTTLPLCSQTLRLHYYHSYYYHKVIEGYYIKWKGKHQEK